MCDVRDAFGRMAERYGDTAGFACVIDTYDEKRMLTVRRGAADSRYSYLLVIFLESLVIIFAVDCRLSCPAVFLGLDDLALCVCLCRTFCPSCLTRS